jgi:hypothetical protein
MLFKLQSAIQMLEGRWLLRVRKIAQHIYIFLKYIFQALFSLECDSTLFIYLETGFCCITKDGLELLILLSSLLGAGLQVCATIPS